MNEAGHRLDGLQFQRFELILFLSSRVCSSARADFLRIGAGLFEPLR